MREAALHLLAGVEEWDNSSGSLDPKKRCAGNGRVFIVVVLQRARGEVYTTRLVYRGVKIVDNPNRPAIRGDVINIERTSA